MLSYQVINIRRTKGKFSHVCINIRRIYIPNNIYLILCIKEKCLTLLRSEDHSGRSHRRAGLETDTPWFSLFYFIAYLGTRRPFTKTCDVLRSFPSHALRRTAQGVMRAQLNWTQYLYKRSNKAPNNFSRYRIYKVLETIPFYGVFCSR